VPCEWIAGPVRREAGEIELTLLLPIGADPGPATAWPEPLEDVPDGAVAFPQDPAPEEPVNVEP
jgi:hypothetical protein